MERTQATFVRRRLPYARSLRRNHTVHEHNNGEPSSSSPGASLGSTTTEWTLTVKDRYQPLGTMDSLDRGPVRIYAMNCWEGTGTIMLCATESCPVAGCRFEPTQTWRLDNFHCGFQLNAELTVVWRWGPPVALDCPRECGTSCVM